MHFKYNAHTAWYEGFEGLSFKLDYKEEADVTSVQEVPVSVRCDDLEFTEDNLPALFRRFHLNPEEANGILADEINDDLLHCTGSEQYHRHGLNRNVLMTDGARIFAALAGAHWLLDIIASVQGNVPACTKEDRQFWRILRMGHEADVYCWDGNLSDERAKSVWLNPRIKDNWRGHLHYHQHIPYTDLVYQDFTLYAFEGGLSPDGPVQRIIMLPSEN